METIRVSKDYEKALVYYIRYEFINHERTVSLDRLDFFTYEWEFSGDKDTDRYILVLDDNKHPVSTIRFLIDENNYGLIERVRTLPTELKKGYAKAAMLEGEAWLHDLGVKKVFVEAIPEALEFYKNCGYSFSNDPDVLRNHDTLLLMEKDI